MSYIFNESFLLDELSSISVKSSMLSNIYSLDITGYFFLKLSIASVTLYAFRLLYSISPSLFMGIPIIYSLFTNIIN